MLDPETLAQTVSEQLGASAPRGITLTSDSWQNLVTGMNDPRKDKGSASFAAYASLGYNALTELYRGDGMTQIIVDVPAREMTRAGCEFQITGNEAGAEKVQKYLDTKLKILRRLARGTKWKRLYGGAGVLIGVNDGLKLDQPVNEKGIKSIDYLNVFDPSEIRPIDWQANPAADDFGEPTMYQIFPRIFGVGASVLFEKVHASRIVRMNGIEANRIQPTLNYGWGDGVIDRCYSAVRDYANSHGNAAALMNDFAQGIYKLKGLANAMGSGREELIRKRIALIDFCRSVLRGVVLDADGEDFERKSTTLAGLSDLLGSIGTRLAAEARMPESKLFGTQPGGLSGGKQDGALELWHKEIQAEQEEELSPAYLKIARLVMLAADCEVKADPEEYCVEWNPLSELPQTDEATMHLAQAQADEIYANLGALSGQDIRGNRFKGAYSLNTVIDEEAEYEEPDATEPVVVSRIDENGNTVEVKPGETQPAAPAPTSDKSGKPAPAPKAPASKKPGAMPGKSDTSGGTNASASQLDPAKTAMAAGQITAVLGILDKMNQKQISYAQAQGMLESMLYMPEEEAIQILGPEGGFTPEPPAVDPNVMATNETKLALSKSKPGAVSKPPAKKKV